MADFKTEVLNVVLKKFPHLNTETFTFSKINQGFTNATFKAKIDGEWYQIRIAQNNNIVDRKNEHNTLLNINNNLYVYYDVLTGNSIKKWIKGTTLKHKVISKKIINSLNKTIDDLHQLEIKYNLLKFDPLIFFNQTQDKIKPQYKDLYLELVNKIKDQKLVLSHNDISLVNTIYYKNNVSLIDFEWTKLNYEMWDYANFIREANLSINKIKYWTKINNKLDFNELLIFLFLTTCYALQWTYVTNQNKKIDKYRKITIKKLNKYYKLLKLNNDEK